ncbi:MAG: NAD(P)-dependent oxidoreductase [Cyanobacteria bacterium P01_C01_bin.89]
MAASENGKTVTVLGMGLMGAPMAVRLVEVGYDVTVWNRTVEKSQAVQGGNANIAIASSAAEAIAASPVTLTMLSDYSALRDSALTDEAKAALKGKTIIQMGTIAPQETQAIAQGITDAGGSYLEATVLGSIPQVKTGTLLVMVGGTPEQFDEHLPLLKVLGPEPQLVGPVGSSAALKLALNQLIASLTSGFAASLGLVQQAGIDLEIFMTILRDSALYAPTFDKKLQRMVDRNFANPNFPTKHLLKDTRLFAQAAEAYGLNTTVVEAIAQVVEQAVDSGLQNEDYSAIYNTVSPDSASD